MPIFANRTIVSMLRDLPAEVRKRCQADLIGRLDNGGHEALAAEWELFVLRQMSRDGALSLPSKDRPGVPDAIFQPRGHRPVVVEVTALNDQNLEENFADDALGMLFYRAINRLTKGNVGSVDVHTRWPVGASGLPTPGLPPRSQLHKFMQSPEVRKFVRTVASAPGELHRLEHRRGEATTTVTFRPGARFSSGSVAGYAARSFNLHNRERLLRKLRKKVKQLSAAQLQLSAVIVLCDADCRMLRQSMSQLQPRENAAHAIFDFISGRPTRTLPGPGKPWVLEHGAQQQTTSINAVIMLTVEETLNHDGTNRTRRRLQASIVRNLGQTKHQLTEDTLDVLVDHLTSNVPPVIRTPMNAKNERRTADNEGGGEMASHRIKLSLLALQDLVTGRTPYETFVARHGFLAQHLTRLAARGQCIAGARVIRDESGKDDDWIELDFSGTDPRNLRQLVEGRDE